MAAPDRPITPWPRRRLVATLVVAAAAVLALLVGVAFAIGGVLTPEPKPGAGGGGGSWVLDGRDQIAAAPMRSVQPEAAHTGAPAVQPPGTIAVPAATADGPADVPSGFPHTPEGAVGQLAAIETRVVEAMSLPVTRQVHRAWALRGAPEVTDWALTRAVQTFLVAAGQEGDTRDDTTMVAAIPAAGLVKGVDGPDWVLACVLLDVRAAITADARIGWGHCERMVWSGGRWLIGPGSPPAAAPSTLPGSQTAVDAGWLTWTEPVQR